MKFLKNTLTCLLVLQSFNTLLAQETPIEVELPNRGTIIRRGDIIRPIQLQQGYSFHYIADLAEGRIPRSKTEIMQSEFGNQVLVIKHKGKQKELAHIINKEQVSNYMAEFSMPNQKRCLSSNDPIFDMAESPNFVSAGRNPVPKRDATWHGSKGGGCGTWATMMCNRILGKTNAKAKPNKKEWNKVAKGIGQKANGGSNINGRADYYENAGYCSSFESFSGNTNSYKKMAKLIKKGCDLKLSFWKRKRNGGFTNGHVEVVTGVRISAKGKGHATTNSWGKPATISGGNNGGFSHSEDNPKGHFSHLKGAWPVNKTEVVMEYVCKCSALENLLKIVGIR